MDKQTKVEEIDWIVKNLSFYFADPTVIEPIAITRAMTVLLRYKYQLDREECRTDEGEIDPWDK